MSAPRQMLTLLLVVRGKEKLRTDIYGGIAMQYKEFNVKYDDSGNGSLGGTHPHGSVRQTATEMW